jgi:RNA polymerase sigma factor (sigma-70 family)
LGTKYVNIHQHLLDRCLKEDNEAQFELYRLYYKSMYNTSLRIVADRADAEDIMQESFLTAFRKLKTYHNEVSFGSWLKKIVINRSLDYLRKRKAVYEEITPNLPVIEEEPEENENFSVEEIKAAIFSLPDGYRTVLSLILLEGYDHEEVAQILGVRNVSSRTQFFRAKQRLKEVLLEKRIDKMKIENYG